MRAHTTQSPHNTHTMLRDTLSLWSAVFLVASIVASSILARAGSVADGVPSSLSSTLLSASLSNTLAVSVLGPAVLSFGNVGGSCRAQHSSNLLLHALPMATAFLVSRHCAPRPSCDKRHAAACLLALDAAWLCVPDSEGCCGASKVSNLYGVRDPLPWMAAFAGAQALALFLV